MSSVVRELDYLYRVTWGAGRETSGIAEPGEPIAQTIQDMPEKLVSCLWFDPRWRPAVLATLDGRSFTVQTPGQWNRQAGPDFRQAVIEYADGERCRGDVEVHRLTSGWTAHRHHRDERYNDVILHVVFRHDRTASEIVRADGQMVPQLALENWLPQPLSAYRSEISLEDYPHKHAPQIGRCFTALQALEPGAVQQFLERAGETRLQRRVSRWAHRVAEVGAAQTLYEAMMRSLGAAGYRQRFQALARDIPWADAQGCLAGFGLAELALAAEALLLGTSGMLAPTNAAVTGVDDETQAYLVGLNRCWQALPAPIQQRAWEAVSWRQPHVRPSNTPERRLAGMAQLLARYHLTDLMRVARQVCEKYRGRTDRVAVAGLRRELVDLCAVSDVSYWSRRSHFGGQPGKIQRLIGRSRALTMVVDVLLPFILLDAQQQGDDLLPPPILACYRSTPRLPDNTILRDMRRRLLGHDPVLLALVTGACHQQGLLQIFEDFCSHDEGDCQGCEFPLRSEPL